MNDGHGGPWRVVGPPLIHHHWLADGIYVVEVYSELQAKIEAGEPVTEKDLMEPNRLARQQGYSDAIAVMVLFPDRADPANVTALKDFEQDFMRKVGLSQQMLQGGARTVTAAQLTRAQMETIGEAYQNGIDRKAIEDGAYG